MPKVSIIIPIYNNEKYLMESIDSVLNQTFQDFEIISINDGSTDNSLKILEEYAKKDSRIKIVTQENKGAGSARNEGLKLAKGEYLAFLDGDDFYNLDFLEKMLKKSIDTNSDIVICRANRFDTETGETSKINYSLKTNFLPEKDVFSYKDIPDKIFNIAQNWNWNKVFKRDFIEKNNIKFQEIYRTNDLYFTCCALVLAKRISTIDECLVNYRIGMIENSQNTNILYPLDFYKAFSKLREFLVEKNIYKEVKESYISWALEGCIYNIKSVKDRAIQKQIYDKIIEDGSRELDFKNILENNKDLFIECFITE